MSGKRESVRSTASGLSEALRDERPMFLCFRVRSQGVAAALLFALLLFILFLSAAFMLIAESAGEASRNEAYVALMQRVRAELNPALYDELLDLIGVDDEAGTEDLVTYNPDDKTWTGVSAGAFFNAYYYSFNVATTIGYGDVIARTVAGKLLSCLIVFFALPVAIAAYTRLAEIVSAATMRRLLRGSKEFQTVLHKYDADRSGALDPGELRHALHELGLTVTLEEAQQVVTRFDADEDGVLSVDEFAAAADALGLEVGQLARSIIKLRAAVAMLLVYAACFAVVAGLVLGLGAVDSIYFTTITLSTVGLGDVTPQGHARALLTVPVFIALGLAALVVEAAVGAVRRDRSKDQETVAPQQQTSLAARLGD